MVDGYHTIPFRTINQQIKDLLKSMPDQDKLEAAL